MEIKNIMNIPENQQESQHEHTSHFNILIGLLNTASNLEKYDDVKKLLPDIISYVEEISKSVCKRDRVIDVVTHDWALMKKRVEELEQELKISGIMKQTLMKKFASLYKLNPNKDYSRDMRYIKWEAKLLSAASDDIEQILGKRCIDIIDE